MVLCTKYPTLVAIVTYLQLKLYAESLCGLGLKTREHVINQEMLIHKQLTSGFVDWLAIYQVSKI